MQQWTIDLTNLQWQLEVLLAIYPPDVGLAFEDPGVALLAAEPEVQAADIVAQFISRNFVGLGSFLKAVKENFTDEESLPPAVLDEIFESWEAIATLCDDELCDLAIAQGVVAIFPEDPPRNFRGISSRKKEGLERLFDPFCLYKFGQRDNPGGLDGSHHRKAVKKLTTTGPYKKFTFKQDTLEMLNKLLSTAPNFSEVTQCVTDAIKLAMKYKKPIQLTPVLLVGDSGIGKSHYTTELSKCLGVPIARLAMDNLQTGAGLAGSSYIYANSNSGEVFKVLTDHSHFSPLVVLDEVDKVSASHRDADPLSPLHNLLEPISAREFRDASIPLPIDASHVIWIATANYLEKIPSTIQSRFEVFQIASQNPANQRRIVENLCRDLEREYPGIEFTKEVIEALSNKTPREQRQLLQRILARTVSLEGTKVTLEHLGQVTTYIKSQPIKTQPGYL